MVVLQRKKVSTNDVGSLVTWVLVAFGAVQVFWFFVIENRVPIPGVLQQHQTGVVSKEAFRGSPRTGTVSVETSSEVAMEPTLPLYQVPELFQEEHAKIDTDNDEQRCKRYGYSYDAEAAKKPRRLFFGTMIADEFWDVFQAHAVEAYNVYHAVAMVESNTTHAATPRAMRFQKGSPEWRQLTEAKLFGDKTDLFIDYWLEDFQELRGMDRECTQRETIVDRWIKQGMTENDVGIMADVDEVFSRDFLRAAQVCVIPQFAPGQTCERPKLVPLTISFESSPECIKHNPWFHPDMVSGQCIEGVGDPTERVIPLRVFQRKYGARTEQYGGKSLEGIREEVKKFGRWPLFNGADMRIAPGDSGVPAHWLDKNGQFKDNKQEIWGVAYHLHNFFDSLEVLRNKYRYYAHSDGMAFAKHLGRLDGDLDVVVRCVRKLPVQEGRGSDTRGVFSGGYIGTVGNKPIFFLNETYRRLRHELTSRLVMEDEIIYGSDYDKNGNYTGIAYGGGTLQVDELGNSIK
jgi:hypothetical protein